MSVDAVGLSSTAGSGDDTLLKKDFGTIGLLFTAVGSIIGSGWLFGALKASQIAGPAGDTGLICTGVSLGPYPAVSKGVGNLGVTAFGVGVGLCAVLTAIVVRRRMAAAD